MIDVTPTALKLGITFPVTITRPLWEVGIVTNQSLPEEDQTNRLRDILLAFRLRLAGIQNTSGHAKEEMERTSGVGKMTEIFSRM